MSTATLFPENKEKQFLGYSNAFCIQRAIMLSAFDLRGCFLRLICGDAFCIQRAVSVEKEL